MKEIQIKFSYHDFDNNYFIETDFKRLQQVILNLFSNSIKFTDRRGKIEIVTKLKGKLSNKSIKVYIRDSGIGIKRENQGKLF